MRSSKSRSRSKHNRSSSRSVGNIVNRVFDSSGPEGKVRGTPQQIIDKYIQLTNDAQLGNDRVGAENFQQHAEHYTRLLGAGLREMEAKREQQEREQRDRQKARDEQHQQRGSQNNQRDAQTRDNRDHQPQPQPQPQPQSQPASAGDPSLADQPDVVEAARSEDTGLVATPEETQPKRRTPRRRKPKEQPVENTDNAVPDTPEAAAE